MSWENDSIVEWYDIARKEHVLQKGMSYGVNPNYSIILMSRRDNALYNDRMQEPRCIKRLIK